MPDDDDERSERLDDVEREYLYGIKAAIQRGDSDYAHELSTGLDEYREFFKT